MRQSWTPEQLAILSAEYPTADLADLSNRLGKTRAATKTRATTLGLRRAPAVRLWYPERKDRLIALYPDHSNAEIAAMLGVSETAVGSKAVKLSLRKTAEFHRERASKSWFKKGCVSHNKGRQHPPAGGQDYAVGLSEFDNSKRAWKRAGIAVHSQP